MFGKKKNKAKKKDYNLTYENVAIPEIHTHKPEEASDSAEEQPFVNYDNVAIPEIHIRKKK